MIALVLSVSMDVNAAILVRLDVLDNYIEVGEDFEVEVYAQEDSGTLGDLTSFGFEVDPSSLLSRVTYNSASVNSDYLDVSSGANNVAGLYTNFGNAGLDVLLAILSFTANLVGEDTLVTDLRYDGFSQGLYYEFGDNNTGDNHFLMSLNLTVNSAVVPISPTSLLLSSGICLLLWLRKRPENEDYSGPVSSSASV